MRKRRDRIAIAAWCALLIVGLAMVTYTLTACEKEQHPTFVEDAHEWDETPLQVRYIGAAYEHHGALRVAANLWNRAVGCELFVFYGGRPEVVADHDPPYYCAGGRCRPMCSSNHTACTYVDAGGDQAFIYYPSPGLQDHTSIWHHELGHVLGLADDPNCSFTTMCSPHARSGPPRPIATSKADLGAVRSRYCRDHVASL